MAVDDLTVVILASGLSQRLGFAKQLILKNNQTLLREKLQLALSLHPYQVLVVLPHPDSDFFNMLYDEISDLAVTVVKNPTPQTGMAESIKLAIHTLQQQHTVPTMRVLFLTVDQVALSQNDLVQLTQTVANYQILVSEYGDDKSILGVPVNVPFGFLQAFGLRLQGDKGFRALWKDRTEIMSQNNTVYQLYPIHLPHLSLDIDTPLDFEQLKDPYQLSLPKDSRTIVCS